MSRISRQKLSVEEASALCGAETIRALATSTAVYSIWRKRGVPWEVTGPLVLERLSQLSDAHSQLARHGGPDMHAVLDLQGRIFQVARSYGIDSKEFQALHMLATLYMPDSLARASAAHSSAAGLSSSSAVSSVRTIKRAPIKTSP